MKLALLGVGLVGGSLALALRDAGTVTEVVGHDIDADALRRARERGVIDRAAAGVAEAVTGADVVVLAVPVGAMHDVLAQVAPHVPAHAVITDVGSTKRSVIDAARTGLSAGSSFSFRRFVPAHPIAGGERPGVEHAQPRLFRERLCVLTPDTDTNPDAVAVVRRLWESAGARIGVMDAAVHDRVFAAVSHLPHLLAFAFMARFCVPDAAGALDVAGAGFRDFTRIAAASPVMWRDICLANRDAIADELRGYRAELERLQRALDAGDGAALERVFEAASRLRRERAAGLDGPGAADDGGAGPVGD
jgi:prephenate dehydrogenase